MASTAADQIDYALRPVDHRVPDLCVECKAMDTDPKHHVMDGAATLSRHFDCCVVALGGCHDGSCDQILAEAGDKRRADLVAHVTAKVVALNKTAAKRDAEALKAHQAHAARHAFIEGAARTAAEAAQAEYDRMKPGSDIQALLDITFAIAELDAEDDQAAASVRLSTGPMHIRLMTTVGSNIANGTELATSGGYTAGTGAGTVTFSVASNVGNVATKVTSSAYTVSNMPATSLNGIEEWDSAGTPLRKQFGGITGAPKTTNAGDTFTIASGSIVKTKT